MLKEEIQAKGVLIGDAGCGKSSIIHRYKNGSFNSDIDSTIGASFYAHSIELKGKSIRISIWDTAGQERYDSISSLYSRNSNAVILVADSTRIDQVYSLQRWHDKIVKQVLTEDVKVYIAVNKVDIENPEFNYKGVNDFAEEVHAQVFKTSAKENRNINELFASVAEALIVTKNECSKKSLTISKEKIIDKKNTQKKGCCS